MITSFRFLVGSSGLEPPTSRLSGARSNHLSYEPIRYLGVSSLHLFASGGDDGIRTHDPLLAGQVLSQLSYTPINMVGRAGLEPAMLDTSDGVTVRCVTIPLTDP